MKLLTFQQVSHWEGAAAIVEDHPKKLRLQRLTL